MADIPRRRMRSASVAIGVTAVVAAALTGCSSAEEDYTAVCVEEDTMERVSDDDCDDDNDNYRSGSYIWYYLGSGRRAPSVGSYVSGGSTSPPRGSSGRSGSSSSGDSDSSSKSGSSSTDYGGFGDSSSGGVSG